MNLCRDVFSSQLDFVENEVETKLSLRFFRVDLSKYFLQMRAESTGMGSGSLCCLCNRSSDISERRDTQAPDCLLLHLKRQSPKLKFMFEALQTEIVSL